MLYIFKSLFKHFSSLCFIFFVSFLVFFYLASTILDSDFGWHLRLGQLILSNGIPDTDPFSYTMPSYPFVDHEWLTNVLIFLLYQTIHWPGLAILFSILGVLSVFVSTKVNNKQYLTVPVILTFAALLQRFFIRPQVISWLFWAIVISIVFPKKNWQKWKWSLPVLILVWVNLHGSFALGLFVILVSCLYYRKPKTLDWGNILVALFSILATFINPYGLRIWWEVWMQTSDISLHSKIAEWVPFWLSPEIPSAFMATIVLFFTWRYHKSISFPKIIVLISTLFLGISAFRQVPFFMLVSIPVFCELLDKVYEEIKNIPFAKLRFWKFYKILTGLSLLLLTIEIVLSMKSAKKLNEESFYPKQAVSILATLNLKGNLFSSYAWGGYLIWKNPSNKVFIDGRMPSFRWVAPSSESNNALAEYIQVLGGKNREKIFAKYNITTLLWPSQRQQRSIWERLAAKLISSTSVKEQSIVDYVTKQGWKEIYKDSVAVIYIHP